MADYSLTIYNSYPRITICYTWFTITRPPPPLSGCTGHAGGDRHLVHGAGPQDHGPQVQGGVAVPQTDLLEHLQRSHPRHTHRPRQYQYPEYLLIIITETV